MAVNSKCAIFSVNTSWCTEQDKSSIWVDMSEMTAAVAALQAVSFTSACTVCACVYFVNRFLNADLSETCSNYMVPLVTVKLLTVKLCWVGTHFFKVLLTLACTQAVTNPLCLQCQWRETAVCDLSSCVSAVHFDTYCFCCYIECVFGIYFVFLTILVQST